MSEEKAKTDRFELATALLLGMAAIGAAWAGYQGGLWGGASTEAYGAANAATTKASKDYNEQIATMNLDYAVDIQAKMLILEAMEEPSKADRNYEIAGALYARYMSEEGYKDLGYPMEYRLAEEVAEDGKDIPDDVLQENVWQELGEEYFDVMFTDSVAAQDEADAKFEEGRKANNIGDKFGLVQVIYTVGLFFAGLGLVFKTPIRWGFLAAGAAVTLAATAIMFSIPMAG